MRRLFHYGLGFAILLASLPALGNEAPGRRWLGLKVCWKKLKIEEVFPDTPAAAAGLLPGDRIISVHGESNPPDIGDDIMDAAPGDPIRVLAVAGGKTKELTLVPAPRPERTYQNDQKVYIPESHSVYVKRGDPLADIDCHSPKCAVMLPPCTELLLESVGPTLLAVKWRDQSLLIEGDFWGKVYTDRAACEKDVRTRCGFFL